MLRAAWTDVPETLRKTRPSPVEWSAHEIIIHCADAEIDAAFRLRMLTAAPKAHIIGYDQDVWNNVFMYQDRDVETAFAVIDAVRPSTTSLLPLLTGEQWKQVGSHSESGTYSAEYWLRTYGPHLEDHVDQIRKNVQLLS